jgi:hypothetical protein
MKLALAWCALLFPALALACPSCARDNGPLAGLFIAGMIGAPYGIGVLAIRAIRRGGEPGEPGAEP